MDKRRPSRNKFRTETSDEMVFNFLSIRVNPPCRRKNERPSAAVILRIYGKAGRDLSDEASAKVGVSPSKKT
jgi:hypothetical protein